MSQQRDTELPGRTSEHSDAMPSKLLVYSQLSPAGRKQFAVWGHFKGHSYSDSNFLFNRGAR